MKVGVVTAAIRGAYWNRARKRSRKRKRRTRTGRKCEL